MDSQDRENYKADKLRAMMAADAEFYITRHAALEAAYRDLAGEHTALIADLDAAIDGELSERGAWNVYEVLANYHSVKANGGIYQGFGPRADRGEVAQ